MSNLDAVRSKAIQFINLDATSIKSLAKEFSTTKKIASIMPENMSNISNKELVNMADSKGNGDGTVDSIEFKNICR